MPVGGPPRHLHGSKIWQQLVHGLGVAPGTVDVWNFSRRLAILSSGSLRFIMALCSLLLFALTSQLASGAPLPRLPIEVHGFNDLGMWPQVLMKGVRWGKLDFSLCTRDSCAKHSTWNTGPGTGNSSDCVSDGKDEH